MVSENSKMFISGAGAVGGLGLSYAYFKHKSWIEVLIFGWAGFTLGFVVAESV